jgi:hypothetical protein
MVGLGGRTPTRCQWCMSLPYCLCVRCHSVHSCSSRAFGGNAPVLCSTVVDAARNGESGSQAHSSHVGGPPTTLHVGTQPHDVSLLTLCNPPSTGHPRPRFVVEACSEGPSHERMPACASTAHLHQPRLQPPHGAGWQSTLRRLVSPPSHPRTDVNTCNDTSPPPLTPLPRLPPRTA